MRLEDIGALESTYGIGGDLTIVGSNNLWIVEKLVYVRGDLRIYSEVPLPNMQELSNLTCIDGDLRIAGLASLEGLENLVRVGGDLKITDNPHLPILSLQAFVDRLTASGFKGEVDIETLLEGDFVLRSQGNLENLQTALAGGSYVGIAGDLFVEQSGLTSLDELKQLTRMGGDLVITGNAALTSLDGLNRLRHVGGDLSIAGNAALTSLEGLYQLTHVGGGLEIRDNPVLSVHQAQGLVNRLKAGGFTGAATIENNQAPAELADAKPGEGITFIYNSREEKGIQLMNPDGTGRVSLMAGMSDLPANLSWSPDGTKLAFTTRGRLHVMNADGSGHLTMDGGGEYYWSPEGTRIAVEGGYPDIRFIVMSIDGIEPYRDFQIESSEHYFHGDASLSPDWNWVAFMSYDLWRTMDNQDCFGVTLFPPGQPVPYREESESLDCCPGCGQTVLSWSPDSKYMVTSPHAKPELQFYRVPGGPTGTDSEAGYAASWSPDGTKIAIVRSDGVYLYDWNEDLGNEVDLGLPSPQEPYYSSAPSWSPDGMRIAFSSDYDGDWDIYVVDRDGNNLVNLTNSPEDEFNPVWSPHM